MSLPLTQIISVAEMPNSTDTIVGVIRQPVFPYDLIRIEDKRYTIRQMESNRDGSVKFVAVREHIPSLRYWNI